MTRRSPYSLSLSLAAALAAHAPLLAGAPPVRVDGARARIGLGEVDELIARGRAALAQGRAAEAQALFEEAERKDAGSPRARVWVARSWVPQGRINDALDAADALDKAGAKGPALDYLYGIAFAAKAKDYLVLGTPGQIVEMAYGDAVRFLDSATRADPALYADAFRPLAEAAWHVQELDVARAAAAKAAELDPRDAEAAVLLGRIAIAQYARDRTGHAAAAEAADRHWQAAVSALRGALATLEGSHGTGGSGGTGASGDPARRALAAQAWVQLGHAHAWKEQSDDAASAYAAALALDPAAQDLGQMLATLGPERFLSALERASASLAKQGPVDAAVSWWLGWARYQQKQYAKAEEAFAAAVARDPALVNAWWYTALSRYHRQDFAGATAAVLENWRANQEDMVASVQQDAELNTSILVYLVGANRRSQAYREAGELCEILIALEPQEPDHWNNAGLFWRDSAELLFKSKDPADKARARELHEKAMHFYSRALEMEPDNPGFLNDKAVMLHYYLDRDLDDALAMYRRATALAEAALARPDLAKDRREWYEIALRDSRENARLLLERLEREGAGAGARKPGG